MDEQKSPCVLQAFFPLGAAAQKARNGEKVRGTERERYRVTDEKKDSE